jgi:hypothetical protein
VVIFSEQAQARRDKNKEVRKRREDRLAQKRTDMLRKISESEKNNEEEKPEKPEKPESEKKEKTTKK